MSNALGWRDIRVEHVTLAHGSPGGLHLGADGEALESGRVQTLRGIACLLLVAFHAVGSTSASGLHVPDHSFYRGFTNLFVHLRMPLFTFLSGFVYACRPLRPGQGLTFAGKKLRRLGVPLLVASTLLYGLHTAMHHQVPPLSRMWSIYVFPYWHLWFVQALLVVFAVLVLLEVVGALATFTRLLIVLGLAVALYLSGPLEAYRVFGVHNATYLLPFFLAGLGAHRFREVLHTRGALIATVVCFVVGQGLHAYTVLTRPLGPIDVVADRSGLNLLIGMSAGLCGLQLVPRMRLMEYIGGSSYPIYLYHPLFVATILFVAGALVAAPTSLVFVAAVAAGVAGPMLMQRLAAQVPAGALLLEGVSASGNRRATGVRIIRGNAGGDAARREVPVALRRSRRDRLGSGR